MSAQQQVSGTVDSWITHAHARGPLKDFEDEIIHTEEPPSQDNSQAGRNRTRAVTLSPKRLANAKCLLIGTQGSRQRLSTRLLVRSYAFLPSRLNNGTTGLAYACILRASPYSHRPLRSRRRLRLYVRIGNAKHWGRGSASTWIILHLVVIYIHLRWTVGCVFHHPDGPSTPSLHPRSDPSRITQLSSVPRPQPESQPSTVSIPWTPSHTSWLGRTRMAIVRKLHAPSSTPSTATGPIWVPSSSSSPSSPSPEPYMCGKV